MLPIFGGQALWLKPEALVLNDGDAVSSWPDSSGNGNTFIQVTGANQPLYKVAQQNGRAGVQFDGINDRLAHAGVVTANSVYSIFIVHRFNVATGTEYLFRNGDPDGYAVEKTSANRAVLHRAVAELSDSAATTNTEIWASIQTAAPLAKLWVNGVNQALTNSTSAVNAPSSAAEIGTFNGALPFGGFIFELIVYDNPLSDTDRGAVENYLNQKYAVF